MRKWQNLAPPDDQGSWYDVDGAWPTNRGSYETADFLTGSAYTAASVGTVVCAWRAVTTSTSTVNPRYVVDDNGKIWRFDSTSAGTELADKTGAAVFGNLVRAKFAQYGSVTIAVLGSTRSASVTGGATISTTAPNTNFAALVGAPAGESIAVVSNAVLITNTADKDGWAASDVGDYTNWSTGEAASGRIYFPAGPILSLVEWNGAGYAFKLNSIHRLRYVGGVVKWIVEKVWEGVGCGDYNTACAGASGILFAGYADSATGSPSIPMYWYDGVNPPVHVNPFTEVLPTGSSTGAVRIVYQPMRDMFSIWTTSGVWYFAPKDMAFGKNSSPIGTTSETFRPYEGNVLAGDGVSVTTSCWSKSAANTLKLYSSRSKVGTWYVETTKTGTSGSKSKYMRATPQLRRLVDAGTQSAALAVSLFRERHDTSTSSTATGVLSSDRHRFDFLASDNFARLKLSYTDYDAEIDDLLIDGTGAGTN
jgi:hypothetical protein